MAQEIDDHENWMCSLEEIQHRTSTMEIHSLEATQESAEKAPSRRIAHRSRCVKKYYRPSADSAYERFPIRTPSALCSTTRYLIDEVWNNAQHDMSTRYEFVFDRFKAVKQDAATYDIQHMNPTELLSLAFTYLNIVRWFIATNHCIFQSVASFSEPLHVEQLFHALYDLTHLPRGSSVAIDDAIDEALAYLMIFSTRESLVLSVRTRGFNETLKHGCIGCSIGMVLARHSNSVNSSHCTEAVNMIKHLHCSRFASAIRMLARWAELDPQRQASVVWQMMALILSRHLGLLRCFLLESMRRAALKGKLLTPTTLIEQRLMCPDGDLSACSFVHEGGIVGDIALTVDSSPWRHRLALRNSSQVLDFVKKSQSVHTLACVVEHTTLL